MTGTSFSSRQEFDPSELEESEFVVTTDDDGELLIVEKSLQL